MLEPDQTAFKLQPCCCVRRIVHHDPWAQAERVGHPVRLVINDGAKLEHPVADRNFITHLNANPAQ